MTDAQTVSRLFPRQSPRSPRSTEKALQSLQELVSEFHRAQADRIQDERFGAAPMNRIASRRREKSLNRQVALAIDGCHFRGVPQPEIDRILKGS